MSNSITILSTGTANVASVQSAFYRLGWKTAVTTHWKDIQSATRLVLPGVGSFGAAMKEITDRSYMQPLLESFEKGTPTLAICLGMQLLFQASEESKDTSGLGVLSGTVSSLPFYMRKPHLGWNTVTPNSTNGLVQQGYAYFAHSFCISEAASQTYSCTSVTTYGERFLAAMEEKNILACQFHPELSGTWGTELLQRWLKKNTL